MGKYINCVDVDFLDKDFNKIPYMYYSYYNDKQKETQTFACFSMLLSYPKNTEYIRFKIKLDCEEEEALKFIDIIFDLFPFMKTTVIETKEQIVKELKATLSIDNHQAILLATLTGIRYIQESPQIVKKIIEFIEKGKKVEEAFEAAHYGKEYTNSYPNGGHLLMPIAYEKPDFVWAKNFRKNIDFSSLENGNLKNNKDKIIHWRIHDCLYHEVRNKAGVKKQKDAW